jgi:hypothetical protein
VAVIEDERALPLHQAGGLQQGIAIQALVIELDGQAARQQGCHVLQPGRIGLVHRTDGREVFLQPGAIERCLVQVLRAAHECAWTAPDRTDQRSEIPTGLWREEYEYLLRFRRNRDGQALLHAL